MQNTPNIPNIMIPSDEEIDNFDREISYKKNKFHFDWPYSYMIHIKELLKYKTSQQIFDTIFTEIDCVTRKDLPALYQKVFDVHDSLQALIKNNDKYIEYGRSKTDINNIIFDILTHLYKIQKVIEDVMYNKK
jgi:hypothetical protein